MKWGKDTKRKSHGNKREPVSISFSNFLLDVLLLCFQPFVSCTSPPRKWIQPPMVKHTGAFLVGFPWPLLPPLLMMPWRSPLLITHLTKPFAVPGYVLHGNWHIPCAQRLGFIQTKKWKIIVFKSHQPIKDTDHRKSEKTKATLNSYKQEWAEGLGMEEQMSLMQSLPRAAGSPSPLSAGSRGREREPESLDLEVKKRERMWSWAEDGGNGSCHKEKDDP